MRNEKPLPERIDLVIERTRVSIADWTEGSESSVTSRQVEASVGDTSARLCGF